MSGRLGAHAHYMGLSGPGLRFAIGLTAGLCFVAFGYGQADIGGLMIMQTFRETFPRIDATGNPGAYSYALLAGVVIASWNIGCFVGAMITVVAGDKLGRRGSALLGLGIEVAGKIVQTSSFSLGQYIAGRVIAGVGNGIVASSIPAWQAECLKTHQRGTMLMVSFGACITLGLSIAYWLVYGFAFAQPAETSWRAPIGFSLFFIVPPLILMLLMPESPRWLMLQAREQEAMSVLSALNEMPEESEDVRREVLQIKNAVVYMASQPASRILTNGEYRYLHRTLLAVMLQVMQQFTGVNLFMQYLGAMFVNQLLFAPRLSMLLAACCSTEFFLASLVAVIGIDRFWGRRTLTIFGAVGMCICMVALATLNWAGATERLGTAYYVMAAFLFAYNTFFAIGWQGMSWMWAVELTPLSIRGPANAIATAASWLSSFIVVICTPVMFTKLTWRTYIVFGCFNAAWVPLIYFLYPETGGRSLEEVDILFQGAVAQGNPWLTVVEVAKSEPHWYDKNGDPTDSSAMSASNDEEKNSSSAGYHSSPDPLWRVAPAERSMSRDISADDGAAPAPMISRHSSRPVSVREMSDDSAAAPAPVIHRHASRPPSSRHSGS